MNPTPSQPERPEPPEGYRLLTEEEKTRPLPMDAMYLSSVWLHSDCRGNILTPLMQRTAYATRTPAPDGSKQAESDHASPPDKCPVCGSPEVEANTPRTAYACGSSDYDQRPGTFIQQCSAPEAVAGEQFQKGPMPCCGYVALKDLAAPVFWNPFNKVVQCHNCGQTYAPTPPADKDAEITALREENKNLRGQYESMKLTTEVATGEHRELSKRLVKDNEARMKAESSLLAANQRIEALEGALRAEQAWRDATSPEDEMHLRIRANDLRTKALAHAAEVGKEQA